jgi:hypothetical protein
MRKSLAIFLFMLILTFVCGNAFALSTYIPHITAGASDWTDYLHVNNNTTAAVNFTLTLYNKGAQIYSKAFTVGGSSYSQIELKALNPLAETGIITYSVPGLVFRVSYKSAGGGVAEFMTLNALQSNLGFYFSNDASFIQWKGTAIANMGTTPAAVTLNALGRSIQGAGGAILGTYPVTIKPKEKLIGYHSSWFNVNLNDIESIVAVADSPSLCGIAVSGDNAQSRLLFTPAPPATNFNAQVSQWDLNAAVNLDGAFPVTADFILVVNTASYYAEITTKKIAGADEPHVVSFTGVINGTTGTITNQVFTVTVGTDIETVTLNGTFTINGNSLTGSGTIKVQMPTGTSNGTVTITGAQKI